MKTSPIGYKSYLKEWTQPKYIQGESQNMGGLLFPKETEFEVYLLKVGI